MSHRKRASGWSLPALGLLAVTAGWGCRRDDPADLSFRARTDFARGRLADAESDFTRLARLRRLTVAERLLRAQVAQQRGRLDDAVAALEDPHNPKKGPEAAQLAARRGELEMERRRLRAAEAELTRALDLEPGLVDARRRLIWLYAQQGRAAELDAAARALARSIPLDFFDLFLWTLARRESLDQAERAELLGRAVAVDAGDRPSRLALAECLRRLGRLDQADSTLSDLPQTDPDARAARARVALDRGELARVEDLLGADSPGESHPAIARLRGRLALVRGDARSAIGHFRAALKAAPDDRDSQFGLGQALRLAGEPEAARPHAETARALDHLEWLVQSARPPDRRKNPAVLQSIAAACLALGRRDQARAWYQLALRHDPGNAAVQQALSRLDSPGTARP
ncbi:MAG TPA: tetratricopeptide repeat protein [Isosphaeraceae bacterium]|nr:tetratricopeptide repeat protein [Isosphaeraceae bacterium]